MAKNLPSINLFKGRQKHLVDKIVNWTLTIGRVIVILAEAVALSAFLYRFSLDRELIDLNDKITQRQLIVERAKQTEQNFRNLQERLALTAKLTTTSTKTVDTLQSIYTTAPVSFTINSISIVENTVKIDGFTSNSSSITALVNALKKHPSIVNVSIDRIDNKASSGTIGLGLTAQLKKEQQ